MNYDDKMIMSNIILFSIIVGRGLAKEIGGPLIENNLLKDDSHRQFSDTRDEEEMDKKSNRRGTDKCLQLPRQFDAKHQDLSKPTPGVQD